MKIDRSVPDPQADPFLTVPRTAAILNVTPRHAYRLVQSGEIPSITVGERRIVVPTAEFLAKFRLAPAA
jgi:excisionase family DNA binding protein